MVLERKFRAGLISFDRAVTCERMHALEILN